MAVTMKEIAKKTGVSRQTVSDVLNNKWKEKRIGEVTRRRIYATAQHLNYRRNNIARSLVMKKTNILGLLIPCVTYSFWPKFARSVEDTARENNYRVLLCHMNNDWQREIEEIDLLLEHRVAGLIVTPACDRQNNEIYLRLWEEGIPFVLIDQSLGGLRCNFVGTDNKAGAYEAVTHLIKLGHTRIAHIRGLQSSSTAQDRLQGYCKALEDNNISFDPDLVEGDGFEQDDGYKAAENLLKLERLPTAIFAVTDMAAIGAMQALKRKGLKIPEDIAIVGFADIEWASIVEPPLTTMRQPVMEMGRTAVQIILKEIKEEIKEIHRVILMPTLIVRESCRANTTKEGGDKVGLS